MLTEKPARARRFLNAGLAVIGFVLVCVCLRAVLPFPEIGSVASHLRYFKKHRNEFDTLFIGSSLIHHDISPAVFDRVMRERGHPTRSFNFGRNGMLVGESSYILEQLLETKPAHLKFVFIELDELETRSFAGAEGSRRDVYWRDSKRTWLLLRKLFEDRNSHSAVAAAERPQIAAQPVLARDLRELLFFHLSLFGKNITNVSRRIDLAWWSTHFWKPDKMPTDLGPDGDGYTPLNRKVSDEKMDVYQYELERAMARSGERNVSAATEEAYRQMAAQVRKAGATPIFLGMPLISHSRLRFRPETDLGTVMSFNDATRYPQLYRREARAEDIHLNPSGAEELSRLVAQNLSQLIDEGRIR